MTATDAGFEYKGYAAVIDTLLMSCRGLGRNIENQFLDEVCRLAFRRGAKTMDALFIPTTKNMQTSEFFSKNGFTRINDISNAERRYQFNLSNLGPQEMRYFEAVEILV